MEKASIFNNFFSRQCQPKSSDSTLLLTFSFQTTDQLSNVNIGPEMCGSSIIKPLQLLFNNCVKQGVYPNIWKLDNVLPVHKKKKICSQIFEKLLFDSIYEFLDKNSLLNTNRNNAINTKL